MINPVSILYIPGPAFPGAESCYKNIRAWRTRYPLILFSEHQWDADTLLLKASPDILGQEHRHKKSNLLFFTALRILRDRQFTHFIFLEADCRVAQHEWDGKIIDEAFNNERLPLIAGSIVCHNMSCDSMRVTRLWNDFIARNRTARFPIPGYGAIGAAERATPCMFLNGALGVYDLKLMLELFAPQIRDGVTAQAAVESPAWDVAIGRLFYERFGDLIFDGRIKHLDCIYSGYGDIQTTEQERLDWLVSGHAVAVHQVKSKETGPLSESDLRIGGGTPVTEVCPPMDILIVTFAKDAEWLTYCLRSIKKFCRGFNSVVIATPEQDTAAFAPHRAEFPDFTYLEYEEPPFPLGNLDHMIRKCRADELCEAPLIAHIDADCVFCRPTTPLDYVVNGKPVLLMYPFALLKTEHEGRYTWKSRVDGALHFDAKFETMCRHPAVHHRDLYALVREHIENVHGKPFDEYVLSCKPDYPQGFAEFPTLGAYAQHSASMRKRYAFIDISEHQRPRDHLLQGHSHPKGDPTNLDNLHSYGPAVPIEVNTHRKLVQHLGLL